VPPAEAVVASQVTANVIKVLLIFMNFPSAQVRQWASCEK
jgi:hypothetical protein